MPWSPPRHCHAAATGSRLPGGGDHRPAPVRQDHAGAQRLSRPPYVNAGRPGHARAGAGRPARASWPACRDGAVLDEVQRAPELLSYLQGVVDAAPAHGPLRPHRLAAVRRCWTASASRWPAAPACSTLLPLAHSRAAPPRPASSRWKSDCGAAATRPCMPRTAVPSRRTGLPAYVATYVERDVRQLLNVGNLLTFQRFVAMCAARSGQLLNLTSLAADCGISQTTARQWLTVLEASHLRSAAAALPPQLRQAAGQDAQAVLPGQRAAVLPAAHRHAATTWRRTPLRGAIFETWVVGRDAQAPLQPGPAGRPVLLARQPRPGGRPGVRASGRGCTAWSASRAPPTPPTGWQRRAAGCRPPVPWQRRRCCCTAVTTATPGPTTSVLSWRHLGLPAAD